MPDIRSFFGGGGAGGNAPKTAAPKKEIKDAKPAKKSRSRKVVSDDEDEDEVVETKSKKSTPVKPKKSIKEEKIEDTTSSAYFESNKAKPSKTNSAQSNAKSTTNGTTSTPKKATGAGTPSSRRSARKTTGKRYIEDSDDNTPMVDDGDGGDDDIHAEDYAKTTRKGDDYEEDSDEEDVKPLRKSRTINGSKAKKHDSEDDDLEMTEIPKHDGGADSKKKGKPAASSSRKRKSRDPDEDEDESLLDDDEEPKKKARKTAAKPAATKKRAPAKKEDAEENKELQDILDSIPTVRAPTPPPQDGTKKFPYGGGNTSVAPAAAGTKEIPEGADDCLAGMTFVFTGVLESLGREEGQNLVKRYGGKVTTGPSSKTNWVVLGADAGPKKLATIAKLGIKTIDEDGLFALIRRVPAGGGGSKAAEKVAEKKAKEEERIRKEAAEMEQRDREREYEAEKVAKATAMRTGAHVIPPKPKGPTIDSRLWVDKYAPDSLSSVCGNKSQVEGLQRWLRGWHKNAKFDFKKAGADGKGIYRAAMLHGPPGIGKTTAAHLVAKLEGFDIVESNASDTRSKKLVESGLTGVLDTTSMLGYFSGDGKKTDPSKRKMVLIMDEVDGMSAGDRGGVGALAAVAKKTRVPMILICNERRLPKMKPFDFVTADFPFKRPSTDMIRGRLATICFREGIRLPPQVLDAIIEGTHADIRQIINMISTIKLDNKPLDFNESKQMSKAWEKHVILKPWDIVGKILRPQMFAPSSTATLNDKIELYFNDHEFSYLMLQENYLKTQPAGANNYNGKDRNLKLLELAESAAESISDGDLVDRMIHGSQQQWSLMPTHAVFSFVRPASFMYGNFNSQVGFAAWLGMNSKQGKLSRFVKEIQGHMRLRSSGDRHEIRQQYLPAVWNKTVKVLRDEGKDKVQDVIDFMDSYYLTRDDFDAMLELGVGPMDEKDVKLEPSAKAAFTRTYNSQSHPMPFIKASAVGNAAAKMGGSARRERPDLEEAIEEDEEEIVDGTVEAEAKEEADEELDLKKDKYIKAPKKKAAPKAAKGKGKGKRAKDDEEEDEGESEEEKPKAKKRASGAGRGRGRGRG